MANKKGKGLRETQKKRFGEGFSQGKKETGSFYRWRDGAGQSNARPVSRRKRGACNKPAFKNRGEELAKKKKPDLLH